MTNLPAGRELDALVAKVMGITEPEYCSNCGVIYLYCDCSRSAACYAPYSTDIAAAWEVVEKMSEHGWVMRLETWGTECSCEFSKALTDRLIRFRSDCLESVPHAISSAALKALELPSR